MYLVKTPWWLRALYPTLTWRINTHEKKLFLTFDDGPHPTVTPFVLEQLAQYQAKATFFCIGNNVKKYPEVYEQILAKGHTVGNHTYHHLNGWQHSDYEYLKDIHFASHKIDSLLFRPPYGKISRGQIQQLQHDNSNPYDIIMWDVLSGDFDTKIDGKKCYKNVIDKTVEGSIIVFHDSAKAWERLEYALPKVLAHFAEQGFSFDVLPPKYKSQGENPGSF